MGVSAHDPEPTQRSQDRPRPLVLVPTYNERENVGPIVDAITKARPDAHVLVIDDNSPDGTGALADELAAARDEVHVLHRTAKQGLGRAYLDPMLRACTGDGAADVSVGSRWVAGGGTRSWGLHRQLISRGGSLYARTVLGLRLRDLTAGFVCYTRRVLESLDLSAVEANGYGFQIEMKYRCVRAGFDVRELPIVFPDRERGTSKMSPRITIEALALVWKLRFKGVPRAPRRR